MESNRKPCRGCGKVHPPGLAAVVLVGPPGPVELPEGPLDPTAYAELVALGGLLARTAPETLGPRLREAVRVREREVAERRAGRN